MTISDPIRPNLRQCGRIWHNLS